MRSTVHRAFELSDGGWLGRLPSVAFVLVLILVGARRILAQDTLANQLDALVATEFRADRPGGVVLVARHGIPLFRRAYGMASLELRVPMRPDHVFKIASLTKQFTAVAVLQLVAEGKIALDDDVRQHLPGFETHGRRITIEQVLTHTSGLPNLVDLDDFDSLLARQDHSVEALLALTKDVPFHFEPGTSYRYSETGYILLAAVIERVSGLSYANYMEAKIFRPLVMRDSYCADDARIIPRLVAGYSIRGGEVSPPPYLSMTVPHGAGALASTVDDLLRWHVLLRSGSVVPKALLERAWRSRVLPDGTQSGYGFGFQVCTFAGHRTIEHGGFINGFLAYALQLPDDNLDVIVLVNNDSDTPDAGLVARRLARFLVTGSTRQPYQTLNAEQRNALVGRYQIRPGETRDIVNRDGVLHLERLDRPARPLVALSPTELTLADTDGEPVLSFELGSDGRATKVRSASRCEPDYTGTRIDGGEVGQRGEMAFYQELAWAPDGSKIAYSVMKVSKSRWEKEKYNALSGTDYEIYVMNVDGTAHRRLTDNSGYDLWLSWAPDSRRVVFSSERNGNTDLYVMNVDGSRLTRMTTEPGKESGPTWSSDGKRIAYASKQAEHWQLWVMSSDGSARRQLTKDPIDHSNPVWSPDGQMLAYYSNLEGRDQVFILKVDGNEPGRGLADGVFPAWSPDGQMVIHGHADKLYLTRIDGSNQRLLIENAEFGRFSPDGRRIAFVMGDFPDTQIYVMEADGTGRRQLTR